MEQGRLIVLEGIDGCGKTTQCKMLAEYLQSQGHKVWLTSEYTNGPIGQLIYKYLQKEIEGDERLINMLYAADRLDHITRPDGILTHLYDGYYVVMDRFYLSSVAYWTYPVVGQEEKFNEKLKEIINWNHYSMEAIKPDLTIHLCVPYQTCMERLSIRQENGSVYEDATKLSMIEASYEKCIQYLRKMNEEDIIIINGNQSIDDLHFELCGIINSWMNYWKGDQV